MSSSTRWTLPLVALVLGACADEPLPTTSRPAAAPALAAAGGVKPRAAEEGGQWSALSDAELWERVAAAGGVVHVGLKSPGEVRGVYRGQVRVSRAQWDEAARGITSRPGVRLLAAEKLLPMLRVRVEDERTLAGIRKLPFVDYVEPARLRVPPGGRNAEFGCDRTTFWDNIYPFGAGHIEGGDLKSEWFGDHYMGVRDAWRRSQGAGVTIGIIDTGMSPHQEEMNGNFASGVSGGRWARYLRWDGSPNQSDWEDRCGHGTKASGLAAAPKNGQNIVGVAWKANLVGVRHEDDVTPGLTPFVHGGQDSYQAGRAIMTAADNGARIMVMAWGTLDGSAYISDVIDYYHAAGTLFIGAAGTSPCDPTLDWGKTIIVFPASKSQVVAVAGVDGYGMVACESHHGPKVEIAAHTYQPTTGTHGFTPYGGRGPYITQFSGSSAATATVGGVAALIWAREPQLTAEGVRQRLREGGKRYPVNNGDTGYGIINAHKALGGMWLATINGCRLMDCKFNYKMDGCKYVQYSVSYSGGSGPYTIRWSNGATTPTTSYQLCSQAGAIARSSINVTVQDLSDGTTLFRSARTEVYSSNPDEACPTCPK